jgi:hypothetical protein
LKYKLMQWDDISMLLPEEQDDTHFVNQLQLLVHRLIGAI